jgi:hypothetical protein
LSWVNAPLIKYHVYMYIVYIVVDHTEPRCHVIQSHDSESVWSVIKYTLLLNTLVLYPDMIQWQCFSVTKYCRGTHCTVTWYSGCMIFLKQFTVVVFLIYYTAAGVTQQLKIYVIDCTKVKPCHCIMSGYSMFHSTRLTLYSHRK